MVWHTLPVRAPAAPERDANYGWLETGEALESNLTRGLDALVEPYANFFSYCTGACGSEAALVEGLVQLETISAALDATIAPLWQCLAKNELTVAEDENKQRADRLFGLDGRAGLLGELKRCRQIAAKELLVVSGAERHEFLQVLLAHLGDLLPGQGELDIWSWRLPQGETRPSAILALPVYLQALALLVLVQGWIGGRPGLTEQAAIARHRAFLIGDGSAVNSLPAVRHPVSRPVVDALAAAAQALVP